MKRPDRAERFRRAEKKRLADHERRRKKEMVPCANPKCRRLHTPYNPDNYCSTTCREATK